MSSQVESSQVRLDLYQDGTIFMQRSKNGTAEALGKFLEEVELQQVVY